MYQGSPLKLAFVFLTFEYILYKIKTYSEIDVIQCGNALWSKLNLNYADILKPLSDVSKHKLGICITKRDLKAKPWNMKMIIRAVEMKTRDCFY